MAGEREKIKEWYDDFTFGTHTDIYNTWSITKFLDSGKYEPYWADTSSNGLMNNWKEKGYMDSSLGEWYWVRLLLSTQFSSY